MFREVKRLSYEYAASGIGPLLTPVLYHATKNSLFRVSIYMAATPEATGTITGAGTAVYATDEYGNAQTVSAPVAVQTTTPSNVASVFLVRAAANTDITYNIGVGNQWLVNIPQPFYFSTFIIIEEAVED
jgi:hypothetical protein